MFKEKFKYFKRKCPAPDLGNVMDFTNQNSIEKMVNERNAYCNDDEINFYGMLKPAKDWKIYEVNAKSGLIFIRNPWTPIGQRYWISKCLRDFTKKPYKLNYDSYLNVDDWFKCTLENFNDSINKDLLGKLRWATLGYHHNWDTKEYSDDNKSNFPKDLWFLSNYIIKVVFNNDKFNAEAAIINFSQPDYTLSGHQDISEINKAAPLLSFSFGLSAIFLVGTNYIEDEPLAMYIDSGDILIMSKDSRTAYHAIPRVIPSQFREVPSDCYSQLADSTVNSVNSKNLFDNDLISVVQSDDNFKLFKNYIDISRINMNVRQVNL